MAWVQLALFSCVNYSYVWCTIAGQHRHNMGKAGNAQCTQHGLYVSVCVYVSVLYVGVCPRMVYVGLARSTYV